MTQIGKDEPWNDLGSLEGVLARFLYWFLTGLIATTATVDLSKFGSFGWRCGARMGVTVATHRMCALLQVCIAATREILLQR